MPSLRSTSSQQEFDHHFGQRLWRFRSFQQQYLEYVSVLAVPWLRSQIYSLGKLYSIKSSLALICFDFWVYQQHQQPFLPIRFRFNHGFYSALAMAGAASVAVAISGSWCGIWSVPATPIWSSGHLAGGSFAICTWDSSNDEGWRFFPFHRSEKVFFGLARVCPHTKNWKI